MASLDISYESDDEPYERAQRPSEVISARKVEKIEVAGNASLVPGLFVTDSASHSHLQRNARTVCGNPRSNDRPRMRCSWWRRQRYGALRRNPCKRARPRQSMYPQGMPHTEPHLQARSDQLHNVHTGPHPWSPSSCRSDREDTWYTAPAL